VQRREGLLAVRLLVARRQDRAVLAVRDRDFLAVDSVTLGNFASAVDSAA
jgi:hypothetical protein